MHQNRRLPKVYLKPGEIYIGTRPTIVTTVLGSCVSVVFFNARRRLGGICHALMPGGGPDEEGCRYVEFSIRHMLEEYRRQQVAAFEIEVKLFGGADMFFCTTPNGTIGQQNIRRALSIIEAEKLNLVASDVGGESSRKLMFFVHSGEVLMKRHKSRQEPSPEPIRQ